MEYIKRQIIFLFLRVARVLRDLLTRSENFYKLLFLPGYEATRWRIGKWKAWFVFENTRRNTPAYKEFLAGREGCKVRMKGWDPDFSRIPLTDKESYIKKYTIESRCMNGRLPPAGVMIDESSGTSGVPNNWVRGYEEREAVKHILQISLHHLLGTEPIFLINAFALGPWATGMNVSLSLVDVTILKSTGPDISKIENTLNLFGPKYRYVITGYPPFLKLLADSRKVQWDQYNVTVIFGGEGMSEEMREYLGRSFGKIYGSYGASDLEINIGAENDFTIALRKLLLRNESLRNKVVHTKYGVFPMVFQYNPLDYYVETNEHGELVITLCRASNIAPKIRYNIHDLGHVLRFPELKMILRASGIRAREISKQYSDLPLLLHYGRSDMAVAFYGCKITPQNIEEVIFSLPELARVVSSFSLLITEDNSANKKLSLAVELREGEKSNQLNKSKLRNEVLRKLAEINQDYREADHMIPQAHKPQLELYDFSQGPFAVNDIRLKKHYIQRR